MHYLVSCYVTCDGVVEVIYETPICSLVKLACAVGAALLAIIGLGANTLMGRQEFGAITLVHVREENLWLGCNEVPAITLEGGI